MPYGFAPTKFACICPLVDCCVVTFCKVADGRLFSIHRQEGNQEHVFCHHYCWRRTLRSLISVMIQILPNTHATKVFQKEYPSSSSVVFCRVVPSIRLWDQIIFTPEKRTWPTSHERIGKMSMGPLVANGERMGVAAFKRPWSIAWNCRHIYISSS